MKDFEEKNKHIKLELNKMIEVSKQICRILDKDDINVEYLNQIGKKIYFKTPNNRKKNLLPNLVYHQGDLEEKSIPKIIQNNQKSSNNIKFKKIFTSMNTQNNFYRNKENKKINDFHSNFFTILKGKDNDKIIHTLLKFENFGKKKLKTKKEEKKIERKLNLMAPEILLKKNLVTKRIPLYIKKYRKNYEYDNNQIILDEINEKRYVKYDDPFIYTLNLYPSKEVLPKYNNLFFKYQKSKIRDYFYKNTLSNFYSQSRFNNTKRSSNEIKNDKGYCTSYGSNKK